MTDDVDTMTEKVFQTVLGGLESLSIALGDRLGLYRALADGPATSAALAERLGLDERWLREWLEQQATMGYLTATADTDTDADIDRDTAADAAADAREFAFAPGAAETLADPDALTTMAPLARMVAAAAAQLDGIEAGARTGHGHPWHAFGAEMREAQAAINKPALLQLLPGEWLRDGLPDVHQRLVEGEPLRIADVGCGAGWASIGLAATFPNVTVDAYDVDPATVDLVRTNVAAAGLSDRVRALETDLARETSKAGDTTYDLAVAVECIHDMPDPVAVLAGVRRMLAADGAVLVIDEKVADSFAPDGDDVERLMYAYSTLICLPDSMSSEPTVATGTVMRRSTLERYAAEAGFARVDVLDVDHDVFAFYRLRIT